ncbi:MAG: glutamate 5-kinase, partial [Moorella sp. (in: Bacteria)]|nr:glutamate 5-kinase [Moorella sp. (in: firmicutes)]
LLTDTAGLFTANPIAHKDASLLSCVTEITPEIEALAGGASSTWSTGGMVTKIQAARLATSFGIPVVITSGLEGGKIAAVLQGEKEGTIFLPREHRAHTRERWLAYAPAAQGQIRVDAGAALAICQKGKSLLPGGVTAVEGDFDQGAIVSISDPGGKEIARGLANYPAAAIRLIQGRKTREIVEILGYKDYDEIVHRDNMIVLV